MDWFKLVTVVLSVVGSGTTAILHASGADKHRTIAGDIARGMVVAAGIVQATHDALASQGQPASQTP